MKKAISLLTLSMAFVLAGCGGSNPTESVSESVSSDASISTNISISDALSDSGSTIESGTSDSKDSSEVSKPWPSEVEAAMKLVLNGYVLPYYQFDEDSFEMEFYEEDDETYASIFLDDISTDNINNSDYEKLLLQEGFVDYYIADYMLQGYVLELDEDNAVFVDFGHNEEVVFEGENYPEGNYIEAILISDWSYWDQPVPTPDPVEGDTISFMNEDYLLGEKNGDMTMWGVGDYTVTVRKGASSVEVGNGSHFSKPLRLYNGQEVTVEWAKQPTSVVFTIDLTSVKSSKSKVENFTANIVGASVEVESNIVTLTPEAAAEAIVITITGGQAHLASVTFVEE